MTILRVLVYRENIDDWICRSSIDKRVRSQGVIALNSGVRVSNHIDFAAVQLDIFTGLQWSVIEVTTAYVISCMPATRFLFVQLLPKFRQLPAVQRARPYLEWMSWPETWTKKSKSSKCVSGVSDASTAHVVAGQEGRLEMGNFNVNDGTTKTSETLYGSMSYSIGSSESRKHGST